MRELKNFKPTPVKPSDAEGNVQKFTMPSAPKSPEEASIQDQLTSETCIANCMDGIDRERLRGLGCTIFAMLALVLPLALLRKENFLALIRPAGC